jgi:hypothetical protein
MILRSVSVRFRFLSVNVTCVARNPEAEMIRAVNRDIGWRCHAVKRIEQI